MKNRAKCKLCNTIIESKEVRDLVECNCGEIAISGGTENYNCYWKNPESFLRVDDEGNVIIPTIKEDANANFIPPLKLSKKELLNNLHEMINNIEKLPAHAMTAPINHYDFCSLLMLLTAILDAD